MSLHCMSQYLTSRRRLFCAGLTFANYPGGMMKCPWLTKRHFARSSNHQERRMVGKTLAVTSLDLVRILHILLTVKQGVESPRSCDSYVKIKRLQLDCRNGPPQTSFS